MSPAGQGRSSTSARESPLCWLCHLTSPLCPGSQTFPLEGAPSSPQNVMKPVARPQEGGNPQAISAFWRQKASNSGDHLPWEAVSPDSGTAPALRSRWGWAPLPAGPDLPVPVFPAVTRRQH